MKEIGIHYEAIHPCSDDHAKYYNLHEFAIECPEFHISRYRTDQVTKKVPLKVLCYIPINSTFPTTIQVSKYSTFYG